MVATWTIAAYLTGCPCHTAKAEPTEDQFCYNPDQYRISMCYWPNGMVCAVTRTPWKGAYECTGRGNFGIGGFEMTEDQLKLGAMIAAASPPPIGPLPGMPAEPPMP